MSRSSLKRLLGRSPAKEAAAFAYHAAVGQARQPVFYESYGVPDTIDGRFEMILLHVFFILHRVRGENVGQDFGQALFDLLFADMDRSLREMGVGDLSVGREIKSMATGFYGRIAAYEAGLAGEGDLIEGLRRNLYGTVDNPPLGILEKMSAYMAEQVAFLRGIALLDVVAGKIAFSSLAPASACSTLVQGA